MTRLFILFCSVHLLFAQLVSLTGLYAGESRTIHIPKDYSTVQQGIDQAVDGDTVLVAPGTYHENINFLGKRIVLSSHFILKGDTSVISETILDGSKPDHKDSASVVRFVTGEDSSCAIVGFTIQNGEGTLILGPKGYGGGGILCLSSSPRITHNIIRNNLAYAYGGGIYCQKGSPLIAHNTIAQNSTDYFGGGIFCNQAFPVIDENILQYNSAKYGRGGGIHCFSSPALVRRNLIVDNTCYLEGGGVCCESSATAIIVNNTLVRNQAVAGTGVGSIKSSTPKIVNNIIGFGQGVSLWCDKSSTPFISHNDFWKNPGENYGNCEPSADNLLVDPLFVDFIKGDFHLKKDSPCIDAGDTTLVGQDPDGTKPDLGAFHFEK